MICPVCGLAPPAGAALCPHHAFEGKGEGWAASNRIWCAFFHRSIPIVRVLDEDDERALSEWVYGA